MFLIRAIGKDGEVLKRSELNSSATLNILIKAILAVQPQDETSASLQAIKALKDIEGNGKQIWITNPKTSVSLTITPKHAIV